MSDVQGVPADSGLPGLDSNLPTLGTTDASSSGKPFHLRLLF